MKAIQTLVILALALGSFYLIVIPALQGATETLNSLSHLIGQ